MSKISAIVLAGGRGTRMKSDIPKQYLPLAGHPVLWYSLELFQNSFCDEIILVAEDEEYCREELLIPGGFDKVTAIAEGGKERYHSVANGLRAVSADSDYVFIHDGARPLLTQQALEDGLRCVMENRACVAAMPVKDTVKIADENGYVVSTPRRDLVWQMQTPQIFETKLIRDAYEELLEREEQLLSAGVKVTDDAGVLELFSDVRIRLYPASYENIKITTPEDLVTAEVILEKRKS